MKDEREQGPPRDAMTNEVKLDLASWLLLIFMIAMLIVIFARLASSLNANNILAPLAALMAAGILFVRKNRPPNSEN